MRIAIFVYGSNLFYLTRELGWAVDLKKLIGYYNMQGTVVDAYYYTAIDTTKPKSGFLNALPAFGFVLVSKPLKTVGHGEDAHSKGNLDIEIVLDMFNTIDTYDMAVLVSGDGDFVRALEFLRARGKRFHVLSHPKQVAKEIREVAGMHYTNIATLASYLRYEPYCVKNSADVEEILEDMADVEDQFPV